MNIEQSQFASKWLRWKEVLLTTAIGDLPTAALGVILRKMLYRTIFKQLGSSVFIQDGVEFVAASQVEIENNVRIFRGVRIDGRGQNSRVCLRPQVVLERGVIIGSLENSVIEIGERTFIAPYACVAGPGNVKIGKDCLIGGQTGIFANNHNFSDLTQKISAQGSSRKGIVIEDDCWLGYGATVLDGVTIAHGSVIGAGAVVTKNIPPYLVVVGVPAKVISSRDKTWTKVCESKNKSVTGRTQQSR